MNAHFIAMPSRSCDDTLLKVQMQAMGYPRVSSPVLDLHHPLNSCLCMFYL